MNTTQTSIVSILVVALLAALPGVYFYTEPPASSSTSGDQTANAATSNQRSNSSGLADFDPVPVPDASELPETDFELSPLSDAEKEDIERALRIDVNSAPQSQLERISGIGPSTAEQIIQYRQEQGGFNSIEDLDQVSGIGPATIDKLRSELKVSGQVPDEPAETETDNEESTGNAGSSSSPSGNAINVNSASAQELESLPGIGPAYAERIVNFRDQNGPFSSVEDLEQVSGIGPATADKLRGQVTF